MDFGSVLHVAQKNEKIPKKEIKYYSTKFEPPKKEERSKQLSSNIKKFLARRDAELKQKSLEAREKKEELLALRSQDRKATRRVAVMLKRTKSANKSVLSDAIDNDNTAVTLAGPSQPDEDDYGYVSQEASAYYNKIMAKYSTMPEEDKFKKGKKNVNTNLNEIKERVRAAILKEQEEALLPHKRKRKHKEDGEPSTEDAKKEEEDKYEREEPKPKPKPRPAAPPPLNFMELLKLAEKKQFEPVVFEPKVVEEERPMTKKQKKEFDKEQAWRERKEKASTPKPVDKTMPPPIKIPKLNSSSNINTNNKTRPNSEDHGSQRPSSSNNVTKVLLKRPENSVPKPSSRPVEKLILRKEDRPSSSQAPKRSEDKNSVKRSEIRPSSSNGNNPNRPSELNKSSNSKLKAELEKNRNINKTASTKPSSSSGTSSNNNRNPSNRPLSGGKPSASSDKNKSFVRKEVYKDSKRPLDKPKQLPPSNVRSKQFPPSDVRPKQFPPSDVRPKQFPPSDVRPKQCPPSDVRPKQFPPSDVRPKQFPPADVRPKQFPPSDLRPKQFPPADVRPKQFPPSDLRPKQFPPADVRGKFPPKDVKRKRPLVHKRRILDDDDSEYDSEMDDFIDDGTEGQEDYSKYISEIFGYDKSRYRHDNCDDDTAMESSFSQMMKEEFISSKIGLMEDLEDIKKEADDKKKKAMMKKMRK